MTPVSFPYILSIEAYNEAGEKVRIITQSSIAGDVGDIAMLMNGVTTTAFNPDTGSLELRIKGIQTPDQYGGGADQTSSFIWNGYSDSGQEVTPGLYYIKISTTDTYGHVNTHIETIQVLKLDQTARINIYNSAGELVRRLETPNVSGTSISLAVDDVIQVGKNAPPINLQYAAGASIPWDGLNSSGRTVDSGIYEIQVELNTAQGFKIMASKTVTILNAGSGGIVQEQKIYPNPVFITDGATTGYATIKWLTAATGEADISIYNIAGELIKGINTSITAGITGIQWDLTTNGGSRVAGGTYVVVINIRKDTGEHEIKKLKMAVVKVNGLGE